MINLCGVSSIKIVIVFVSLASVIKGTLYKSPTTLRMNVRLFIGSEWVENDVWYIQGQMKMLEISALEALSAESSPIDMIQMC